MLRGKQLQTIQRMSAANTNFTNKLAAEKSPYLLQHKNNPIEWYPWGDEAINRAKSLNRPIFLSVGYSTCHWCHVMERESFELHDVANALNESFVSIKVDREERPDVDKLYMSFVQAISGSGGWPMSVFLTPSLDPFFGGTYFPRTSFLKILKLLSDSWAEDPAAIVAQGKSIMDALGKGSAYQRAECPPLDTVINGAFQYKASSFDKTHGGFGTAPKFPKPVDLDFLLNFFAWSENGASKELAREMIDRTLEAMSLGGIHDHIGKGFHRYSVDDEWHVPHFEKMLYDQTQLMSVYSGFMLLTDPKYGHVVRNIADYMMECLHHPEGGFYAAEDADSLPTIDSEHKKEGAFCVWTKSELEELLAGCNPCGVHTAVDVFCRYFDVHDTGNVPSFEDPHAELTNQNVLRMKKSHAAFAADMNVSEIDLLACIDECKAILRGVRRSRPPPHLDSKMVTSWQGLAISAFTKASAALSDNELLLVAERCAAFVKKHCTTGEDQSELIRAVYRGENNAVELINDPIAAFSDDYALMIQGLLDLYTRNGDDSLLQWADKLQSTMNEKFWDRASETGYFISEEDGNVHLRIQEDQDHVEPCANSVALSNLVRLSELLDCDDYKKRARMILEGSAERLSKYPYILPKMIPAYKRFTEGGTKIVIVGDPLNEQVKEMLSIVDSKYIWDGSVVRIDTAKPPSWLLSKCTAYASMMEQQQAPMAMICRGFTCGIPLKSADQLRAAISPESLENQ